MPDQVHKDGCTEDKRQWNSKLSNAKLILVSGNGVPFHPEYIMGLVSTWKKSKPFLVIVDSGTDRVKFAVAGPEPLIQAITDPEDLVCWSDGKFFESIRSRKEIGYHLVQFDKDRQISLSEIEPKE